MNQIFEKLGIYDLVAVLLSGICITTFSLGIDRFFFELPWLPSLKLEIKDAIPFFVVSYLVGLLFQELSSLFYKLIFYRHGNKLLQKAFDTDDHMHPCLTTDEKDGINKIVQNNLRVEKTLDQEIVYNYCKFYLINTKNMARADKDQSTFGLSRSLALYFALVAIAFFFNGYISTNISLIVYAVIVFSIAALLYFRCIRFAKMRYVNMLRAFYYSWLQSDLLKEKQTTINK